MSHVRLRCGALAVSLFLLPTINAFAQQASDRFPANKATDVNPDTHLVLTFSSPPTAGASGKVRIIDTADNKVIDTLDMSIPPGPGVAAGGQPPSGGIWPRGRPWWGARGRRRGTRCSGRTRGCPWRGDSPGRHGTSGARRGRRTRPRRHLFPHTLSL